MKHNTHGDAKNAGVENAGGDCSKQPTESTSYDLSSWSSDKRDRCRVECNCRSRCWRRM